MPKYQHGDIVHVAVRIISGFNGCYAYHFEGDRNPQNMTSYHHRLEVAEIKHIPKPHVWKAGDEYTTARYEDSPTRYKIFYIDDQWVMRAPKDDAPTVISRKKWDCFNKFPVKEN